MSLCAGLLVWAVRLTPPLCGSARFSRATRAPGDQHTPFPAAASRSYSVWAKLRMKTKILVLALSLTAPLFAADAWKILLSGTSVSAQDSKASGSARAVVGDFNITADVIQFDQQKNILRCEGTTTIRTSSGTVTAKDCVVELGAGEKKLFFIDRGEISFFPKPEPFPTKLVPASK